MFYLCYLYLFTYTGAQHDFHVRLCSCRLTATRRMLHVEQQLLILPEHVGSPPVFSGVSLARSLVFCVVFYRSLFVLLAFFFWQLLCLPFFDLRLLLPLW